MTYINPEQFELSYLSETYQTAIENICNKINENPNSAGLDEEYITESISSLVIAIGNEETKTIRTTVKEIERVLKKTGEDYFFYNYKPELETILEEMKPLKTSSQTFKNYPTKKLESKQILNELKKQVNDLGQYVLEKFVNKEIDQKQYLKRTSFLEKIAVPIYNNFKDDNLSADRVWEEIMKTTKKSRHLFNGKEKVEEYLNLRDTLSSLRNYKSVL